MKRRQSYVFEAAIISQDGKPLESDCVDMAIFNYGTNDVLINDVIRVPAPVAPSPFTYISLEGKQGEIDRTKYVAKFLGAGTSDAIYVRRIYQDSE